MSTFQQMMNWYCNSVGWTAVHEHDSTMIPFCVEEGREKRVFILSRDENEALVAIPSIFSYEVNEYISEEFLDIFRQRNEEIRQNEGIDFDVWDLITSSDSKELWVSFTFQYQRLNAEGFQQLIDAFLGECVSMEDRIFEAIEAMEQQQSSYQPAQTYHQSNEIDWDSVLKKGFDILDAVIKLDDIFDIF